MYGSLVLVAGLTWAAVAYLNQPLKVRPAEQWLNRDYPNLPEVKLLQEYVRIDTSEATGDELAGARFLATQFAEAGIPTRIEPVGPKKANLYAWLEGEDPRPLVLHNHIDVSAANPKDWFVPPFEGHIELPWIYGRGVFDMKSVAIAQMLAMIDLKKSGVPLKRSVLFLATSSEERGSRLGVRRLVQTQPEMVRNFWAVLTEGGVVEARSRDDIKFWGTEFAQKRYADLTVCSDSRERLEDLRKMMKERGPTETDLHVTPEVHAVLEAYAPTRDRDDLRDLVDRPRKGAGRHRRVPQAAALPAVHVPQRGRALPGGGGQGRRLPDADHAPPPARRGRWKPRARDWCRTGCSSACRRSSTRRHPPGAAAHWTTPCSRRSRRRSTDQYPGVTAGPYFLAWTATDARFFRTLGVPVLRLLAVPDHEHRHAAVDQANERFALPGFVDGVELYSKLVRRLVSDT